MSSVKSELKLAGITIPKGTKRERLDMIEIGLQLKTLDNEDIEHILDPSISVWEAQRVLTGNRKKGEIKHLTYLPKQIDRETGRYEPDDLEY